MFLRTIFASSRELHEMASRSSGRTGDRPCARGRAVNDALRALFLRGGGALAQDKAIGVEGGRFFPFGAPIEAKRAPGVGKEWAING